ncbi:hypothetical protein, partial [Alloscardovia macacae]
MDISMKRALRGRTRAGIAAAAAVAVLATGGAWLANAAATATLPTRTFTLDNNEAITSDNFTGTGLFTFPTNSTNGNGAGMGLIGVNNPSSADLNGLEFTVYGGQMTGESVNIPQLTMTYNGGQATNTMGRQIYGQTAAQVQDAAQQAPLWKGKRQPVLTANKNISSSDAVLYSSTGAMDLFMSVVEPRGYEQGTDKVYIPDFSKRIQLSDSAKAAGWSIEDFTVTGLPAGVAYDSQTDTIQGSIIGGLDNSGNNSIEYGFQGAEVNFTAKN